MQKSNTIPTTRKQPRKQAYIYHWDRIFAAIAILLVLIGVITYGLYAWFASSPQEDLDMAEALPDTRVATEGQRPSGDAERIPLAVEETPRSFTHEEQETLSAQVAESTDSSYDAQYETTPLLEEPLFAVDDSTQQDAEGKPVETESPSSEVVQLPLVNHPAQETAGETSIYMIDQEDSEPAIDARPSEDTIPMPLEDELSASQAGIPQDMPLDREEESPDSSSIKLTTDTKNSPFQLKELKIIEPRVKRFLLTRSVSNREPRGELNDISFNANGSAAVWVYSEVVDKSGSLLKYVWLHDGKQVAKVRVKIRGDRWRSYSNKIINQSMSGAWRVELQDGDGRLLASADFFLEGD